MAFWEHSIDVAFGNWLAGFVDGEGCFQIRSVGRGSYLLPGFSMALRLDDRAILEEIMGRTGLGRMYFTPREKHGSRDQATWMVGRKADVAELARIFDRYPLRAKKAADFAVWRQGVALWTGAQRTARDRRVIDLDFGQMRALKTQLESGRLYRLEAA